MAHSHRHLERRFGTRHWKSISTAHMGTDGGVCLLVCPLMPGETVKNIRIAGQYAGTNDAWKIGEINWRGLIVPAVEGTWMDMGGITTSTESNTSAEINFAYRNLVRNAGSAGGASDQFFGGDSAQETSEDELIMGAADYQWWKKSIGHQWFIREKLLKPISATHSIDLFDTVVRKNFPVDRPSVLVFGMHRFESSITNTNHGISNFVDHAIQSGASTKTWTSFAFNPEWIEEQLASYPIQDNSSTLTNLVQALQGNNYIESGTSNGDAGIGGVKVDISIETPIKSALLGTN